MNLKTRLRKLEKAAPVAQWAKEPQGMTDDELDAEIQRVRDEMRQTPDGAAHLARVDAIAREQGEAEAIRAEIEYLDADLNGT